MTLAYFTIFIGSFKRRKRKSIIVTAMLFVVSILILVFGLAATTRTQNITVGGYYPGVIVSNNSYNSVTNTFHFSACAKDIFLVLILSYLLDNFTDKDLRPVQLSTALLM